MVTATLRTIQDGSENKLSIATAYRSKSVYTAPNKNPVFDLFSSTLSNVHAAQQHNLYTYHRTIIILHFSKMQYQKVHLIQPQNTSMGTVFERKVLRKVFGPVKDKKTVEWRIRRSRELLVLLQKPNIILDTIHKREITMGWSCPA